MIVVTGAAGFIGSAMLALLEEQGYGDLVAVDAFDVRAKEGNLQGKKLREKIHRDAFPAWLDTHGASVQIILHIGARTDTAEFDDAVLNALNLDYSKTLWALCVKHSIPFIYASSAATYGDGAFGFDDTVQGLARLQPLNPYGWSKHHFDIWVQEQAITPPFWAGFKFFNVFGPNEYHKQRMASVVYHAYNQIQQGGNVRLFKSHKADYQDGMQLRDFIYVKDVVKVLLYFMEHRKYSDLYNLGTGTARSFLDLAKATFDAMKQEHRIEYVDIPADIREKYQYYTCANMHKLREAGYSAAFMTLEEGIKDYVSHYLIPETYY